eukprot:13149-Heterococcus_DN1.PRE.2
MRCVEWCVCISASVSANMQLVATMHCSLTVTSVASTANVSTVHDHCAVQHTSVLAAESTLQYCSV